MKVSDSPEFYQYLHRTLTVPGERSKVLKAPHDIYRHLNRAGHIVLKGVYVKGEGWEPRHEIEITEAHLDDEGVTIRAHTPLRSWLESLQQATGESHPEIVVDFIEEVIRSKFEYDQLKSGEHRG